MIGYPNAMWDKENNKPIMRKGITATKYMFDYNGKKEFLIDIASFEGSSGSPIIAYEEVRLKGPKEKEILIPELYLLGVLYAGAMYKTTGEIFVTDIPTSQREISETYIPMNLGIGIKSEKVSDFKNLFTGEEKMQVSLPDSID